MRLFQMLRRPPVPSLFPYTTLFRSVRAGPPGRRRERAGARPRTAPAAVRGGARRLGAARVVAARTVGRHPGPRRGAGAFARAEEHTSELQSLTKLVCRLLLVKKKTG